MNLEKLIAELNRMKEIAAEKGLQDVDVAIEGDYFTEEVALVEWVTYERGTMDMVLIRQCTHPIKL